MKSFVVFFVLMIAAACGQQRELRGDMNDQASKPLMASEEAGPRRIKSSKGGSKSKGSYYYDYGDYDYDYSSKSKGGSKSKGSYYYYYADYDYDYSSNSKGGSKSKRN